MLCQQCGKNQATVNMTMQINNQTAQLHVCNQCFSELQGQIMDSNNFFGGNAGDAFSQNMFGGNSQSQTGTRTKQRGKQKDSLLDQLGKNLTDEARGGKVDSVIGRDNEIKRVVETLNRRNKNNPVLIGEPGVGKTAIAEGLAVKIIEGDVPSKLMNKEVYILDVASLVANTSMRGQFEERMKQL